MKPNRFLAVPSSPRYVGEEGCGAGQIPELRISKLLKTSRFLSFLKAKNNDGSWVWLKPEVQEGDAITQDSIRPEKIAKLDAEEREQLKLKEDCEAAKNESSGRKAFELYQDYKQRGIQIDGEPASRKFLEIAAGQGWPEAIEIQKMLNPKVEEGRFGFDSVFLTKVCVDVKRYVEKKRNWCQDSDLHISAYKVMGKMREDAESCALFGLNSIGYGERAARRVVVEHGLKNYRRLTLSQKARFLEFLWCLTQDVERFDPELTEFASDLKEFVDPKCKSIKQLA